jgi:hypothetical protein
VAEVGSEATSLITSRFALRPIVDPDEESEMPLAHTDFQVS